MLKQTANGEPPIHVIDGQRSWRIANKNVEAHLTCAGGHLGPITFKIGKRKIQPLSVAPWHSEVLSSATPQIIKALRGDFFCLPFGGNTEPFRGERHPVHGETANADWKFFDYIDQDAGQAFGAVLHPRVRRGNVYKAIILLPGSNAVYSQHIVTGMSGPMNWGHHAMLKFPDEPGSGIVSTSRFVHGQVLPGAFEQPAAGGYSALQPGAMFKSLRKVSAADGPTVDLSRYPARRGFEDLVMLVNDPKEWLGWSAVTFPKQRYVWFGLKNSRVLNSTVLWISNAGRHYAPWNGRHAGVMGIEEITGNFHLGLAASARSNALSRKGYRTSINLRPDTEYHIKYIMGVAEIPKGFDRVASITPDADHQHITITAASGKKVRAFVDVSFLFDDTRKKTVKYVWEKA
jgi:hypothetical protein